MGSGSSSHRRADEEALRRALQQETDVLNKLVDVFHVDSEYAQKAIKETSALRLFAPTVEDCLKWIESNPSKVAWKPLSATGNSMASLAAVNIPLTKPKAMTFCSKEQVSEMLSKDLNQEYVPLRTNGNGNCLFNAVILCLRYCGSPAIIQQFQEQFFNPAIQARHIFEDEVKAGLQLRLNLADRLDQDWTKSGISSADHPEMSEAGKIRAKITDGPMVEAQLDRLRSIDINQKSGQLSAAWGDASDDLMSLCKIFGTTDLRFKVYVGTATAVPTMTGTWLNIFHENGSLCTGGSTAAQDSTQQNMELRIYASGSHFTAIVKKNAFGLSQFQDYQMDLARARSVEEDQTIDVVKGVEDDNATKTTSLGRLVSEPFVFTSDDHFENSEVHEALLQEQNKRRNLAKKRNLQLRLGERRLKNRTKMIESLQATALFEGVEGSVLEQLLDAMEIFYFEPGCTICLQGQAARNCMLILTGEISIFQRPRLGARPRLIGKANSMDFLGETALCKGKRFRGATLMATGSIVVQVLVLSRRDWNALKNKGELPKLILNRIKERAESHKQRDTGRKAGSLLATKIKRKHSNNDGGTVKDVSMKDDEVLPKFTKPSGNMMSKKRISNVTDKNIKMSKEDAEKIVQIVKTRMCSEVASTIVQEHREGQKKLADIVEKKRRTSLKRMQTRLIQRKQKAQLKVASRSIVLRAIKIFADLSAEHMAAFIKKTKMECYGKNEMICTVGDESDRLWILTKGAVEIIFPPSKTEGNEKGKLELESESKSGSTNAKVDAILNATKARGRTSRRNLGKKPTKRSGLSASAPSKKVLQSICVFGETALFDDLRTRTVSVKAESGIVELLSLSRINFFNLCSLMENDGDVMLKEMRDSAASTYDWKKKEDKKKEDE